ncbi:MotE family protein [Methylobacterium sp.]|uniref:MotE family protein n=1 Tax=Methylobacterium sp. TaxID=409 RepID=UPI00258D4F41|nr:MotE family protein [Methylobacterium sp.]
MLGLAGPAAAQEAAKPSAEAAKPSAEAAKPSAEVAKSPAEAVRPPAYCAGIADAAADARFAWQKETLADLEKQVEERIRRLEAKRAEYEEWLARRNAFLAKADEAVVAIYTKMRPDAAALQLANMPDEAAAALLTKLSARAASTILSEMEASRAAHLARLMTTGGRKPKGDEKS